MSAFFQDKHNNKRLSVSGIPLYVCAVEGKFGGWRPLAIDVDQRCIKITEMYRLFNYPLDETTLQRGGHFGEMAISTCRGPVVVGHKVCHSVIHLSLVILILVVINY